MVDGLLFRFRRVDYINQVRLQHACALLETIDLPTTTISEEVGFCDSRYVATRFRHALGQTLREFRASALARPR